MTSLDIAFFPLFFEYNIIKCFIHVLKCSNSVKYNDRMKLHMYNIYTSRYTFNQLLVKSNLGTSLKKFFSTIFYPVFPTPCRRGKYDDNIHVFTCRVCHFSTFNNIILHISSLNKKKKYVKSFLYHHYDNIRVHITAVYALNVT